MRDELARGAAREEQIFKEAKDIPCGSRDASE
jgi:hypothetical protein